MHERSIKKIRAIGYIPAAMMGNPIIQGMTKKTIWNVEERNEEYAHEATHAAASTATDAKNFALLFASYLLHPVQVFNGPDLLTNGSHWSCGII